MEQFIGEIRAFAFSTLPQDWLVCDGSVQSVSQYRALFDVIGTTYGGDGRSVFQLPDLRGRAIVAAGAGEGLSTYKPGMMAGQETVALTLTQLHGHTHSPTGTLLVGTKPGQQASPAGAFVAAAPGNQYGEKPSTDNMAQAVKGVGATTGNNEGHENRQPFLVATYAIAAIGYIPEQA